MAVYDETAIKRELADGKLKNLYVICGQEPFLKDFYYNKIISLAVDEGFEAFNFKKIDGTVTKTEDLLESANQMPLMGDYNCCAVKDFPLSKLNQTDAVNLCEYIKNVPSSAILIFYLRDESFPPKASKDSESDQGKDKKKIMKELYSAFSDNAVIIKLDRKSERDLIALLCSGAKKRGAELSTDCARLMINLCGNDLYTLLNELDKICAYTKKITETAINKICTKTLEATAFEITDNMFTGNLDKAFLSLKILLEQRTPAQMILGSLIFPFVDIYRIKTADKYKKTTKELMTDFSYSSSFRLDKARKNGKKISERGIKRCLEILDDADTRLKSFYGSDSTVLEETIVKLRKEIC